MILAATTVYHLYAARLVGGIVSAGILIVVPIYVSEIADDRFVIDLFLKQSIDLFS